MDGYYILGPLAGGVLALIVVALLMLDIFKRPAGNATMTEISTAIQAGARTFLGRLLVHLLVLAAAIFILAWVAAIFWPRSGFNRLIGFAFLIGVAVTAAAGLIGTWVATRSNSRAAEAARVGGVKGSLRVAMNGGAVMGLTATGLALLGFCLVWRLFWIEERPQTSMSIIGGYALGASLVALLAQFASGIFSKGADVGADVVSVLDPEIPDNDLRNPATIADHLGDNLGDIAGFGSDMMHSFIVALIAALSIAATLRSNVALSSIPILLATAGVVCSIVGIFFVRLFARHDPRKALLFGVSAGVMLFTIAAVAIIWAVCGSWPPARPFFDKKVLVAATLTGILAGAMIGIGTDIFASGRCRTTRRIAASSQFGSAMATIEGLRAGMLSCALPAVVIAAAIWIAYDQAGAFGIALAAVGMLATSGMVISMNGFGPIAENSGGIAGLAHLDRSVREITDLLDMVGNTTTALAKGFANGASALVTFVLLAAFIRAARVDVDQLTILSPRLVAGLVVGGATPFFAGATIMGAISRAAADVIAEVRRQMSEIPGILEGKGQPDSSQCIHLAARHAIRGMLTPTLFALALPVVVGFAFGAEMLTGLLAGAAIGGLMLGAASANAGVSLSSAKRYIEDGVFGGKGSPAHGGAVVGDIVGDPLKDAVAPAINTLIKTMAVVALIIAPLLRAIGE